MHQKGTFWSCVPGEKRPLLCNYCMCRAVIEIHIVKIASSLAYLLMSKLTANHHAFDIIIFVCQDKDVNVENRGKREKY